MTVTAEENKMGTKPVWSLLLTMALPVVLSTVVQSFYNIVDGIFVSQISEAAMTAITFTQPLTVALLAVGMGISVGMNTMLSHSLGEKNREGVDNAAKTAIFLVTVSAILSLVASVTLVRPFMATQTSNPEIFALGVQYISIYLALGIGTIGQMVFERMLISTGKTVYSMISQMTGAVLNLVLDPILIFGWLGIPALGIRGAALATVCSQIIAMVISLVLNIKVNREVCLRFTLKPPVQTLKRMLYLGVPTGILISLNAFMMLGLNTILNAFSTAAVAAMGACSRITTLFYNLVNALANTTTPIVAFNHGARKKRRMDQCLKYGFLYSLILTAVGSAVCIVFARQILQLFHATEEMMTIGVGAMRLMSCGYMLLALRNVNTAVLQSLGHSVQSMAAELCRNYVLLLPLAWLLARATGSVAQVFWAYPIADALSGIMSIFLMVHFYRKDTALMENREDPPTPKQVLQTKA